MFISVIRITGTHQSWRDRVMYAVHCTDGPIFGLYRQTSTEQAGIIGRGLYCPFHCSLVPEPLGITDSYFNRLLIPPVISSNSDTFNSWIFIKQIRRQLLRLRSSYWTTFSLLSVRNKCIGYYKIGNYSFRNSVLNFLTFYPKQDILYSLGKWEKMFFFKKKQFFFQKERHRLLRYQKVFLSWVRNYFDHPSMAYKLWLIKYEP